MRHGRAASAQGPDWSRDQSAQAQRADGSVGARQLSGRVEWMSAPSKVRSERGRGANSGVERGACAYCSGNHKYSTAKRRSECCMAAHTTRYDRRVVNAQQRSECRCWRVALNALMEAGVTQRSPYSHQRVPLCVRTPHTLRAVCVSPLRSSAATAQPRAPQRDSSTALCR